MEITREIASKVLEVVDAGLVKGLGQPLPGQMCVEAAVCFAMGLPHSDEPTCVAATNGARDKALASFAEDVVQILVAMKAPGCEWLDLAPL